MLKTIMITVIDHEDQRYNTVGDYQRRRTQGYQNDAVIRISDTGSYWANLALMVHELIELTLVEAKGISDSQIDAFDQGFEGAGEPGDDMLCPYNAEHRTASLVETDLLKELGLPAKVYEELLDRMIKGYRQP